MSPELINAHENDTPNQKIFSLGLYTLTHIGLK